MLRIGYHLRVHSLYYDYSNPAVNKGDILDKRSCKHCGGYFGDINLKNSHEKECKKKSTSPQVTERLRPSRAKARRGVELLCMLEDDDH